MKRFVILLFLFLIPSGLIPAVNQEYLVKAVFLEKFTNFVDWPKESSAYDSTKPFIIGIVGENPFGKALADVYAGQKIFNKRIEIRSILNITHCQDCQIIFIARSEKDDLPEIIKLIKDKPILTVSDTEGFAKQGVMINLYIEENTIKFEVNEPAVRQSPLKVSHLLLNMARIVK